MVELYTSFSDTTHGVLMAYYVELTRVFAASVSNQKLPGG